MWVLISRAGKHYIVFANSVRGEINLVGIVLNRSLGQMLEYQNNFCEPKVVSFLDLKARFDSVDHAVL